MKTLFAYIELARPLNGFIAFISGWLGGMFASKHPLEDLANPKLLLVASAAWILLSAGNTVNDYCDYNIDRVNRPERPLPSGRIPKRNAPIFTVILLGIGIVLGTLIGTWAIVFALLVSGTVVSYAFYLKRVPFIGNIVVSGLTGVTFIAGGMAVDSVEGALIPATFAFLFTTAREIVKDLEDTEGDRRHNVKTLAILNPRLAVGVALGFMAAVILFSPVPYLFGWYSWYYFVAIALGVDLVLIGLGIRLWRNSAKASCASIQYWMKWDIFVGLGAIYLGTF